MNIHNWKTRLYILEQLVLNPHLNSSFIRGEKGGRVNPVFSVESIFIIVLKHYFILLNIPSPSVILGNFKN